MNGLSLRVSSGKSKKSINNVRYSPVILPLQLIEEYGKENNTVKDFMKSTTADDQLTVLRTFLSANKNSCDRKIIMFFVIVFLQAEAKHPVKCFLTRFVTREPIIEKPFTELLAIEITRLVSNSHTKCSKYEEVVSKISMCIENFPAGAQAVHIAGNTLVEYLTSCLECCLKTLRKSSNLSPTEKNEIFTLVHLTLRVLLHIIQKTSSGYSHDLISKFGEIRGLIKQLVFDEDVPMDTKSVCGIMYLIMHILENGADSWIWVLMSNKGTEMGQLLTNEAAKLSLYSAVATVMSAEKLHGQIIDGCAAVIVLLRKILAIGERNSSESTIILSVTRSVLQISKTIDKAMDTDLGLKLVEDLLLFVWSHLEHHMDSVRHLTAQVLSSVVGYCKRLKIQGNDNGLEHLFTAMSQLDCSRKSFYVCATSLGSHLSATYVIHRLPVLISDVMHALSMQAVQATATTSLETLLDKYIRESSSEMVYTQWVQPILTHVATNTLDSTVHNILENLLTRAVKFDGNIMEYMLSYVQQYSDSNLYSGCNLKCVLMVLSVMRKCGGDARGSGNYTRAGGVAPCEVLRVAAVHADAEIRILSLSLVVESLKSTEIFTKNELDFVLWYLKYNINTQSPNFRQFTLSYMKKFMKRLEDSYKVLMRQNDITELDYYLEFVENLRKQCFDSLLQGANYSRRLVALQMLVWCELLHLDGYDKFWSVEYVEKLLLHLEDSYESNKAFALHILLNCPIHLLQNQKYIISLNIKDVLSQASSVKPTDCVSAAYKLLLLKRKLPDYVLGMKECKAAEPVSFALLQLLLATLQSELRTCERSIVDAASRAPMYGLLYCMGHLFNELNADAIAEDDSWRALVEDVITTCVRVNAAVACVVNNSSPEGHLPMDMTGVEVTDHGNSGGVRLADGRQVSAQMVLLCAWRSVKEVSLLLGSLCSQLSIAGEDGPKGTLSYDQLCAAGQHLTQLLAETKHRGAFEQAYVGFTSLLSRLWRCRSPALHSLPREWVAHLMATLVSERRGPLCATRRSAGLPFMIQALLTTEQQVEGNPKCFHQCMTTLLRLALPPPPDTEDTPPAVETRTHCVNILRALFRNSALDESVAGYVEEGLIVALKGFEGRTWMERNSSTLLFSALMTRTFGVQRSKDSEQLCLRNRMTGRIFFLRYPRLYNIMLEKLKEVSDSSAALLHPSLYPVLLLLSRLYPSSLEGTVSNLKLVSYVPHVVGCARSSVLKTRQLAARAVVPLVTPELYLSHINSMFSLICTKKIQRNFCHGILLQLTRLLNAKPDNLALQGDTAECLMARVEETMWILEQCLDDNPCYILADEYTKMLNFLLWRFPCLLSENILFKIQTILNKNVFETEFSPLITFGREIYFANAVYLLLITSKKLKHDCTETILKSLSHKSYEVVLAALDSLLILNQDYDKDSHCKFKEHLSLALNSDILRKLTENEKYIKSLSKILRSNKYLECTYKCLKLLILEKNTERQLIAVKNNDGSNEMTDKNIYEKLLYCIKNEHESLTHIYLESLLDFVSKKLKNSSISESAVLDVLTLIFEFCSSDNNEQTRNVVVKFLEENNTELLKLDLDTLSDVEKFEYKATFWSTLTTLLDDDESSLRQRVSNIVVSLSQEQTTEVIPSKASEIMRNLIETYGENDRVAMFVVLSLLDFRCQVYATGDGNDECRVFDQNERYNIFLEESVWTSECANKIVQLCKKCGLQVNDLIQRVVNNHIYTRTFDKLCGNNINIFKKFLLESSVIDKSLNPKIELFVKKLS